MEHRQQLALAEVLEQQTSLNATVAQALQAVALTADRYDAELAEHRRQMDSHDERLIELAVLVRELRRDLLSIERTLNDRTAHLV